MKRDPDATSDADAVSRIASGDMDPAILDMVGLIAATISEHDALLAENERLRRRIDEEEARLRRA